MTKYGQCGIMRMLLAVPEDSATLRSDTSAGAGFSGGVIRKCHSLFVSEKGGLSASLPRKTGMR